MEKGATAICAHFIVSGKVRVEKPILSGEKALYLKPPSWIGDVCLFMETLRKSSVTAVIMTETLCMQKSSIKDVCRDYPSVNEQFVAFREKIMSEGLAGLVCPYCYDVGHSEECCPQKAGQTDW